MNKQEITERIEKAEAELKQLREELNREKVTYSIGDRFINGKGLYAENYILACIDKKRVSLISLDDGGRWNNGVVVRDMRNISGDEMMSIYGIGNFAKI